MVLCKCWKCFHWLCNRVPSCDHSKASNHTLVTKMCLGVLDFISCLPWFSEAWGQGDGHVSDRRLIQLEFSTIMPCQTHLKWQGDLRGTGKYCTQRELKLYQELHTQHSCLLIYNSLIQSALKFKQSAQDSNNENQEKTLHMFFLSIVATNKCNLVRGKEKEPRERAEKLSEWAVGSHFNENLFMDSFFFSVSNGLLHLGVTLWIMHSPVWSQTKWGR